MHDALVWVHAARVDASFLALPPQSEQGHQIFDAPPSATGHEAASGGSACGDGFVEVERESVLSGCWPLPMPAPLALVAFS